MKRRGRNRVAQRNPPAPHRIDQPRRRRCYFRSRFANARRGCHNGNTHPAYCAPPTLTTCRQCYYIQVQLPPRPAPCPAERGRFPYPSSLASGPSLCRGGAWGGGLPVRHGPPGDLEDGAKKCGGFVASVCPRVPSLGPRDARSQSLPAVRWRGGFCCAGTSGLAAYLFHGAM